MENKNKNELQGPGKEEIKTESYSASFIKSKFEPFLKNIKDISELKNLDINISGKEIIIDSTVVSTGFNIKVQVVIENMGDGITVKSHNIDAKWPAKGKAEKKLEPQLNKISEMLKSYIEKEKGGKIEKLWIENGELKALFMNEKEKSNDTVFTEFDNETTNEKEPEVAETEEFNIAKKIAEVFADLAKGLGEEVAKKLQGYASEIKKDPSKKDFILQGLPPVWIKGVEDLLNADSIDTGATKPEEKNTMETEKPVEDKAQQKVENDKKEEDQDKVEGENETPKNSTDKKEITQEDINKRAGEIYEKRLKDGTEGDQDSDWAKAEKELKDEQQKDIEIQELGVQRAELEKKVEETRTKYLAEYKKCKNEADRQKLIAKTKNSIFNIFKSSEKKEKVRLADFYTKEFNDSKKEYDETRKKLGDVMYDQKRAELEKAGLTGSDLEKAVEEYSKAEIIAKTIVEEAQKVIDAKAEKPALFKKLLDGYSKMPRWQKIAISTAIFTAAAGLGVVSGGVLAGYGLGAVAGGKVLKSVGMGMLVGHTSKAIDWVKKGSDLQFIKTQYYKKEDLKDKYSKGEIGQEEYEAGMDVIEKADKSRARNRTMIKMSVGIALAGTAGHYAYDAMGNGISHAEHLSSLHNINNIKVDGVTGPDVLNHPITPPFAAPTHISIEATADHGQGAISTLRELQNNLKVEYGDHLENAPASVKHILSTDPHKLAEEYGMYKPGADAESAFIKSGSSFKVDGAGNVTYHEVGGQDITLEKGTDVKVNTMYEGKMSDTDHSGLGEENIVSTDTGVPASDLIDDKYKLPPQVDPITGKVPEDLINKETFDGPKKIIIGSNGNEIITTAPLAGLSIEDLHQIRETFDNNIHHFFPTKDLKDSWDIMKVNVNADRLMYLYENGQIDPGFDPFINHIKQLEEMTGFKPITESPLHPAESITHFMNRAMEQIQLEGKLDEVKL